MNSIQRVLAALTFGRSDHGEPDRVPVLPVPLLQGSLVHQCTAAEYFARPASQIADAQIRLNEMLSGIPDGVAGFPHVVEDVTPFGVKLVHPYQNCSPTVDRMRIADFSDIDELECPTPDAAPQLRKTLDTIGQLRKRIGSEKVVIGACIAPFSLPSMLMGTSKWMRLLYTTELRERYFARIIEISSEFVARWANQQLQAGAHVVVLADGMASSTILPRALFERLALPVIQDTIGRIRGLVAYEPVGRAEPFLDLLAGVGAVALLIGGEDDITACKQAAAGRVALIGNINNMKMRRWSPARVELLAKSALNRGKPGFGFALANQGPELPLDVPIESIRRLVEAVEKYGRYAKPGGAPATEHAAAAAM